MPHRPRRLQRRARPDPPRSRPDPDPVAHARRRHPRPRRSTFSPTPRAPSSRQVQRRASSSTPRVRRARAARGTRRPSSRRAWSREGRTNRHPQPARPTTVARFVNPIESPEPVQRADAAAADARDVAPNPATATCSSNFGRVSRATPQQNRRHPRVRPTHRLVQRRAHVAIRRVDVGASAREANRRSPRGPHPPPRAAASPSDRPSVHVAPAFTIGAKCSDAVRVPGSSRAVHRGSFRRSFPLCLDRHPRRAMPRRRQRARASPRRGAASVQRRPPRPRRWAPRPAAPSSPPSTPSWRRSAATSRLRRCGSVGDSCGSVCIRARSPRAPRRRAPTRFPAAERRVEARRRPSRVRARAEQGPDALRVAVGGGEEERGGAKVVSAVEECFHAPAAFVVMDQAPEDRGVAAVGGDHARGHPLRVLRGRVRPGRQKNPAHGLVTAVRGEVQGRAPLPRARRAQIRARVHQRSHRAEMPAPRRDDERGRAPVPGPVSVDAPCAISSATASACPRRRVPQRGAPVILRVVDARARSNASRSRRKARMKWTSPADAAARRFE